MGVYDFQIGQQVARVRNVILPIEVDVLTHGGEVLVIEPLPAWDLPGWETHTEQSDQDGNLVLVPLLIDAMDPLTIVSAGYDYKAKAETHHTLMEEMVATRGDAVLAVPSYMGIINESQTYIHCPGYDYRTEQPGIWRFWNGIPVTDANRDAVKAILTYGAKRISASHWETLSWLGGMSEQGEGADAFDMWAYVVNPALLNEYGEQIVLEHLDWEGEEDVLQTAVAYQEMVDLGYLWDGRPDPGVMPTLQFDSMDEALIDYPDAVRLWNTIVYRRQLARSRYFIQQANARLTQYTEDSL